MARKLGREPFYCESRGNAWYVWHGGKQVRLHAEKDKAFAKWHQMMAAGPEPEGADRTVADMVNDFLEWTHANKARLTWDWYGKFLGDPPKKKDSPSSFAHVYGTMKVRDLKPLHVTKWLKDNGWKGTTANCAVRAVLRCFNWATKEKHIDANPIKGVEKPAAKARDCYIKPENWKKVVANVTGEFREFVLFARMTGARPQEIRAIAARHLDAAGKAIVFPREESKGKKRQRIIPLTPAALAVVERLAAKYPSGPLFRNTSGKPWTNYAIALAFSRLRKRIGVPVCAYAVRHTFATDALVNGTDPITVANIMGHTDLKMLMETYSKVQVRQDHMQAAIMKAVGDSVA